MITKLLYGVTWQLIYYHNIVTGTLFNSTSAYSISNEYQYSIIGSIGQNYKKDGYFEYLLEYPELGGYNRWKQKIDIKNTVSTQTPNDIGFTPIDIRFNNPTFGGISKSNSKYSIFDGTPAAGDSTHNYWYSIGPLDKYYQINQFPGPYYGQHEEGVTLCYLWINNWRLSLTCKQSIHHHTFSVFIYILLV